MSSRRHFGLKLLIFVIFLAGFFASILIQDSLAQSNVPSVPTGLRATAGEGQVTLSWNPNPEPDIWFYKIYISLSATGPFSWNASAIHPATSFTKTGLFNGVTYYFKLSAVNKAGLESAPTEPVSATPSAPPSHDELVATPGNRTVLLNWNAIAGNVSDYSVYASTTPSGPYYLLATLPSTQTSYTVTSFNNEPLNNDQWYYFQLYANGQTQLIGEASASPSARLGLAKTASSYVVQYYLNEKPVRYRFRKLTVEGQDGLYEQFASEISFNDIPVTASPYPGGLSGLILMYLGPGNFPTPPHFSGIVESFVPGERLTLRYTSTESSNGIAAGDAIVWMSIEASKPYLKIRVQATPSTFMMITSSWNVFSAIGGQYNPRNRVVVPYDEKSYYVINGQALGIHYNPHQPETWSLRMGAEGTPYEHITTGFFSSPTEMRTMAEHQAMFHTPNWPMGHDYCDGSNGDPQDSVPFGLDEIYDIYLNYQEDEGGNCIPGGLGYSWQNALTAIRSARPSEPYVTELYYWVGEDNWTGEYGLNDESQYRFAIDIWQDVALGDVRPLLRMRTAVHLTTSSEIIRRGHTAFTATVDNANAESTQLQVFDLAGRKVFDSGFVRGRRIQWDLLTPLRQPVANGVYLYRVTVRTRDGTLQQSAIRWLVVLR
jgi:hypothetical protein